MAQITYLVNPAIGVEGLTKGDRKSRPLTLASQVQITTVTTANGAGTNDWVITIVDDETGETFTLTATGSGTEATLDANMEAAFAAHDSLRNLFTLAVTSVSDVVATFTAKHANRTYTFSATGGTGANTVANTQTAGGTGVEFGRFVRAGSTDESFEPMAADTTLAQIRGCLFRTDGNHFRLTDGDSVSTVDRAERGRTYAIAEVCRMLVKVEEAVTPASTPYIRRALTSSAGRLGGLRASPAGTAQVATITVTADKRLYSVQAVMVINGVRKVLSFQYAPTDDTTTTDDAIDGLEDAAAAAITAQGFTGFVTASTASAAATMTLTTLAGTEFESVDGETFGLDAEVEVLTVALGAADVDALYAGSICSFETSAAADGLAWLKVDLGPQ